ncbi:MAG TPA: nicotinate phosphoribosyltransferase [Thermoanaerobaculia bacterium]|nr:nicotinate phosphoribosyltransferase [Thermoanaerobaculia bacterium]
MRAPSPWVDDGNAALLTDLYELTMLQAYWREGMADEAVFSLYYRTLPDDRSYLLACGLDDALRFLETLSFDQDALEYLAAHGGFSREFLGWLGELRFAGDVWALPEGTPVFPEEPLLEVRAPIAQAQLAESFVMNQVHLQTVLASKAVRVVEAARGRAVIDFGLRRMHGTDAAMKGARAYWVAGLAATSNVLAGRVYGVPIAGTMAHSFVQAHEDELTAFRAFARLYPDTVLLVDTYDTLLGIDRVIELARELGDAFRVRAVRLDSGDLAALAVEARRRLDAAGLHRVEVFASGGLDEHRIAELVARGAPIDGFGVGTRMGVSEDAPALDMAYKLTAYAGEGRLKLSPGKKILPGRKQVFRIEGEGRAVRDVIARADEEGLPGRPLLVQVMAGGERLAAGRTTIDQARERARDEIARLPERLRALAPADPPYPVEVSAGLRKLQEEVIERIEGSEARRER